MIFFLEALCVCLTEKNDCNIRTKKRNFKTIPVNNKIELVECILILVKFIKKNRSNLFVQDENFYAVRNLIQNAIENKNNTCDVSNCKNRFDKN